MLSQTSLEQNNYLQALLNSHSTQALKATDRLLMWNKKCQNQIEKGKLKIQQVYNPNNMILSGQNYTAWSGDSKLIKLRSIKSQRQSPEAKQLTKEEHQKFLRHLNQQKRLLKIEKETRKKQAIIQFQKEQIVRLKLLQQSKLEKQIQKKRQLQEKINQINLKRSKRKSQMQLQNKMVQKIMISNPLYQRLQKKYMIKQAQSLQISKKKLAEIRSLHKPITRQDLAEHQKKYDQIKQQMIKRQQTDNVKIRSASLVDVYKSHFYRKAIQQSKDRTKEIQKQKQLKNQLAYEAKQKIKQYHRYVKGNFQPQIDDRLVQQLKNQNNIQIRKPLTIEEHKQKGQDYLKFNLANKRQKIASESLITPNTTQDINQNKSQIRIHQKIAPKTDREHYQKQKVNNNEMPQQAQVKQDAETVESIYLKKQKFSLSRKRSKSQIQQDVRILKRKQNDLNDIIDQGELDQLYDRILKVKMSIDKKK